MKTSPVYQFVFRVLAVFALTAGLFLGTEGGSSAQDETIGTPEHPIKILFTPYVDAQVILDGGEVMVNYLQQVTGLIFEINVPLSDAATVEEMCASPDDSMGFLPGFSYVLANDLCGVDVSYKAIMYGWDVNWSEILVPRDSTIQSVADLDGLTWGIPEYSSYSGYMTPMAMWNRAGITPGEVIETGGHSQAVMAVYSGAVDFATTYFSPPRKPAEDPAWQPGDDPDIPDNLVNDCGISQDGKLMCGEWRVMDARTMILSDAPDVVQKVRILEISPPVANETVSFGPDFPDTLRTQIEIAMFAFAGTPEWGDSIGSNDFYRWQGISPATDAEYDFTREIVAAVAFDIDGDNIADVEDNAPTRYNPDQSDIDSDSIGDVADICPSDPLDECNASNSTSESVGSGGGSVITPQGSVGMDIPAGALDEETSMSITDVGSGFGLGTNLGQATAVFGVEIGPAGTEFITPVTIVFSWSDDDKPGWVDGTNAKEENLLITKDNVAITGKCKYEPADGVLPDCDMTANTFAFQVSTLSEFALVTLLVDAGGPYLAQADSPIFLDGSGNDPDSFFWTATVGDFNSATIEDPIYIAGNEAGIFDLTLQVTYPDNLIYEDTTFVVVYDPDGGLVTGFVTGGGWIWSPAGAYAPDPTSEGKATFGFVSKCKKGTTVPTGNTEFVFQAGDLNFHSTNYEWLVVNQNGTRAQFKGIGTINGEGEYKFMLRAGDNEPDTFHIKIWWEDNDEDENVVYDNESDQAIGGGNIVVHIK